MKAREVQASTSRDSKAAIRLPSANHSVVRVVLVLLLIDVGVRVMNFRSRLPGLVALIALALPHLAVAQMPDTGLAERVAEVVTRHPALGIFDEVIVEATNGAVRLTGRVTTRVKRDAVAERAAKINGVLSVANEIQVLPNSPLDARLRARVAQTIYGHPSFWRYASMANPPIHIIVENGHVTLTGCVNGDSEKALAFALAQVEGAVGVKNELRGEVRRE